MTCSQLSKSRVLSYQVDVRQRAMFSLIILLVCESTSLTKLQRIRKSYSELWPHYVTLKVLFYVPEIYSSYLGHNAYTLYRTSSSRRSEQYGEGLVRYAWHTKIAQCHILQVCNCIFS